VNNNEQKFIWRVVSEWNLQLQKVMDL